MAVVSQFPLNSLSNPFSSPGSHGMSFAVNGSRK